MKNILLSFVYSIEITDKVMAVSTTTTTTSKKSSLYTRTGDTGTTSLYDGTRKAKNHAIVEALGNIDELNSHIGLARSFLIADRCEAPLLATIQCWLLDAGSAVATPRNKHALSKRKLERTAFDQRNVTVIEREIDHLDSELSPLRNFILPSGGSSIAQLHVCRAVCRRAERSLYGIKRQAVDDTIYAFFNRLSDYFFVLARSTASLLDQPEMIYRKDSKSK